jgi:hypothetical protein
MDAALVYAIGKTIVAPICTAAVLIVLIYFCARD